MNLASLKPWDSTSIRVELVPHVRVVIADTVTLDARTRLERIRAMCEAASYLAARDAAQDGVELNPEGDA